MKRYGGSKGVLLDEVVEAECYVIPPVHVPTWRLILATLIKGIKLIPITIVLMAIVWGLSFAVLTLLGVQPIS